MYTTPTVDAAIHQNFDNSYCTRLLAVTMPDKRKRPYSNLDFTLKRVFKKACFRWDCN